MVDKFLGALWVRILDASSFKVMSVTGQITMDKSPAAHKPMRNFFANTIYKA